MKSLTFYILFYIRPFAGSLLKIIGGLSMVLGMGFLIGNFIGGFGFKFVIYSIVCMAISFSAFILRKKYISVLLSLQPEGTEYSFYD